VPIPAELEFWMMRGHFNLRYFKKPFLFERAFFFLTGPEVFYKERNNVKFTAKIWFLHPPASCWSGPRSNHRIKNGPYLSNLLICLSRY
jgi:hypothetical protein